MLNDATLRNFEDRFQPVQSKAKDTVQSAHCAVPLGHLPQHFLCLLRVSHSPFGLALELRLLDLAGAFVLSILSCVVRFNLQLKCGACAPASPHRACCGFEVWLVEGCHFGSSSDMITSETQQFSVFTDCTLSYYPLLVLS